MILRRLRSVACSLPTFSPFAASSFSPRFRLPTKAARLNRLSDAVFRAFSSLPIIRSLLVRAESGIAESRTSCISLNNCADFLVKPSLNRVSTASVSFLFINPIRMANTSSLGAAKPPAFEPNLPPVAPCTNLAKPLSNPFVTTSMPTRAAPDAVLRIVVATCDVIADLRSSSRRCK